MPKTRGIQTWSDRLPDKLRYKYTLLLREGVELPPELQEHGWQFLEDGFDVGIIF